jgi:hypothetical protein
MLTTADFIEEDKALVAVATTAGRRRTGRSRRLSGRLRRGRVAGLDVGNDRGEVMGGGSTQD